MIELTSRGEFKGVFYSEEAEFIELLSDFWVMYSLCRWRRDLEGVEFSYFIGVF